MIPRLHSVAEAAEQLRCSASWIYKGIEAKPPAKPLPHIRRNHRIWFTDQQLREIAGLAQTA